MHYFSCWIKIGIFFAVALATAHTTEPSMTDLKEIKRKWDECCKTNICIHNSCYSMEWRASGWSVVRQRCQGRYPDWPYAVDIFRIQNETDVEILSEMLKDPPPHMADKTPIPTAIWTSGTRCPQVTSQGVRMVTRWTSSNHTFPEWLEKKVSVTSTPVTGNVYSCQFLVISTSGSKADIKYDFQEQSTRNVAICEFWLPMDIQTTTTSKRTEISTTEADITSTITEEGITSSSTETDATSTSIKTDNIPASTKGLGSTPDVTTFITTAVTFMKSKTFAPGKLVSQESSKQQIVTMTMEPVVANSTFTNTLTSTAKPKYCKQTEEAGIIWPDTEAGTVANISCPEGMIGYAQWKCDERTLEFIPNKPHIQNCKHVWIKNLEDSVKKREDAVKISYKLAEETRYQDMSHGDISALVDLSAKVLHLYSEQKGEEEYEIAGTQKRPPVSYNFTRSMVASFSNILRAEIKKAWEILPEIHQTRVASKILMLVTTMGSRLSCIRMSQDKLQFTVKEENIDLQTFILDNKKKDEVDLIVFPQEAGGVRASSLISLSSDLGLKNRLSPCTNYNSAVGVIYNNVGDFLKDQKLSDSSTKVATNVISFSLSNNTESIPLPEGKEVSIVLQHNLQKINRNQTIRNPRCMFWNFSKNNFGEWDDSGCFRVSSNNTHTVCKCNHLTNFAVLMDINDNIKEDQILSMMTYVCCGISSLTLILTVICFLSIRSLHGRRSIITGNLCFSLLITNLLVIFGLDQTHNKILCAVIAGLLHFWILSAFCWMLVEGYHLYRMVILVFQRGSTLSIKLYYIFAYGTSAIVVSISAAVRSNDYARKDYCWLSSNNGLMWSFAGPACAIISVNIIVFILTLRSASSVRIKREQSTLKKIKSWVRGSMSVMCLLGLTWCVGLFYIDKKLHFFSYIFTILNGLQGVFIFFFHVLLNDKVNSWCSCKGSKQDRRKYLNQTSSNRLHSKTSTRTSMNSLGGTTSNLPISNSRSTETQANMISSKENGRVLPQSRTGFSNSKKTHINYRKNKATHTMSETMPSKASSSYVNKIRSRSLPEDT